MNVKKKLTVIFLLIFMTACLSSSEQTDNTETASSPDTENIPQAGTEFTNTQDTNAQETLTISSFGGYNMNEKVRGFKARFPNTEVVLTEYDFSEYEKYFQTLSTKLMSGTMDDIFSKYGDSTIYGQNGLLTDFYEFIKTDGDFSHDNYYLNVFEACAFDGKLFFFPLDFAYYRVSISKAAPEQAQAEFAALESASCLDLIRIYSKMDGAKLGFERTLEYIIIRQFVSNEASRFIDYTNLTCDFDNPDFIDMLNAFKSVITPEKMDIEVGTYSQTSFFDDTAESAEYTFKIDTAGEVQYLLPYGQSGFSRSIPLTLSNGELNIFSYQEYCIPAYSKNKELAWEFLKYLSNESVQANDNNIMPVNINGFWNKYVFGRGGGLGIFKNFIGASERYEGIYLNGDEEEIIADSAAYLHGINMQFPKTYSYIADGDAIIIDDEAAKFFKGLATAEQTAKNIQNKVSIRLTE
ncbi:MAG: ABC transporter substrate-binding protein [Clostridiales bacterium]|nr:ABC transporter substrate-binding protein [Clostridiales bacterium]